MTRAGAVALLVLGPAAAGGCGEAPERAPARGDGEPGVSAPGEEASGRRPAEDAFPAIAITVDDLPWVGPLPPGADRLAATEKILAALGTHDVRATGFVNCGRIAPGAPVLERWLAAGHRLGNHTEGHLDLNRADPAAWAADARRCDASLRELTGEDALPFRYPYLHRGPTAERYRAGRETLAALRSTIAPVTVDTGDWIIDDAYVEALRAGDEARAEGIAGAYLDHVVRAAEHYRTVADERVDREVPHVLLLHANALLAEHLDALLAMLADRGFRFVPLETALEDPLYALEDDYLGPEGLSWLYRIPPATPEARAWDDQEAQRLRRLAR